MASLQGWGRQTWNSGAWDTFAPVDATGNGLTSSFGSLTLTGDCNITLTGIGTTSSTGTAIGTGVAEVSASGNSLTSSFGSLTVTGTSTVTATGNALTSSIGDESVETLAQSGWDRGVAGDSGVSLGWSDNLRRTTQSSYAFSGNALTSSLGTPTTAANADVTPSGVSLTSSTNTPGTSIFVTGTQATSSIGTFSISGDSQLTVVAASEPEVDALVGQVTIAIGKTAFPTGNVITPSLGTEVVTGDANVTPTGVSATSSLGTETVSGSAPVTVTGNESAALTSSATATAGAIVTVTGNAITSNIGDAGQETSYEAPSVALSSNVGTLSIRTDVTFTITGVSGTSATGTLQGTFWSQVDDSNSDISWTEVHIAA